MPCALGSARHVLVVGFTGSEIFQDPDTKKPIYGADDGDLFTVANFANAILDLPFASTADDANRSYVANTEQIPPRGTMVTMFLRPRPEPAPEKPVPKPKVNQEPEA